MLMSEKALIERVFGRAESYSHSSVAYIRDNLRGGYSSMRQRRCSFHVALRLMLR